MNKLLLGTAATAIGIMLAGSAMAQPSSKFSAFYSKTEIMAAGVSGDTTATAGTFVKVPSKKDLLIGVSLQTAVDTSTKVSGKNGGGGSAKATGEVMVTVRVGGVVAEPGSVIFEARTQELSAVLGGVIESCDLSGELETIVIADDCEVSDESISLLLETTSANHFNFLAPNLDSGTHEVTVEVQIMTDETTLDVAGSDGVIDEPNVATASAVVGPRMVTIQTVRGANNPDSINSVTWDAD
jgi:hypothetical protein